MHADNSRGSESQWSADGSQVKRQFPASTTALWRWSII